MYINNYKQFEQNSVLMLPPHEPKNELNQSILMMSELSKLYPDAHTLANKINSFCVGGIYMTVKDYETGVNLISQQEPMIIFGVDKGREITVGPYNGVPVDADSIVIFVKSDDSLFFLSLDDEYILTFTRPKIQISDIDPFGEEDWS